MHERPSYERPRPSTPRCDVGVVGAGRVGAVLAAGLRAAGHRVTAVSGRSAVTRTRVETMLPGVGITDPANVAEACDLVLLSVPDDVLGEVVAGLVAGGHLRRGQVVVHTSGRHGVRTLDPVAQVGSRAVAMHPAMTFTGSEVDLTRLSGCVFGLTAGDGEHEIAEALVADLGGRPVWVPEAQRTTYHAAIAHGANHLVTLVSQAADLLRRSGVEDPSALLRPLLGAALDNVLDRGEAALTGPVVRGDVTTVSAHLDALADAPAGTRGSYAELASATVATAVADGRLSPERGREIRRLLRAEEHDTPDTAGSQP